MEGAAEDGKIRPDSYHLCPGPPCDPGPDRWTVRAAALRSGRAAAPDGRARERAAGPTRTAGGTREGAARSRPVRDNQDRAAGPGAGRGPRARQRAPEQAVPV
ncbi:hypothetical protein SCWH03_02100 [Streptomyces pacificus]|uniref:Uncharacterized protein n=1 Tax=Streptomyces pacificus TaxID=2705029 RepID=A0A6A0ANG9_9ACTN|nr:hypothetical protein SCWH03_02100 [Streptomyces pacificus]